MEELQKENEELELKCPQCGKSLIKRTGKFGTFIACSGYPECKYIHQDLTKAMCPGCNRAPLTKRVWKGNVFWSCKSYPACKFGINADIIEKNCPKCNFPFLKKETKSEKILCARDGCDYIEE